METLLQDLRYGVRVLLRRPVFTLVAVLSLGLGIGANTAIFSVVNSLLWHRLPVADPDRLVTLYTKDVKNPGFAGLARLNLEDYRARSRSFSGILGYQWAALNVLTGGEPELSFGQLATANYFDVLGVRPALGRAFLPEEDGEPGAHPVTVLSHPFWKDRLGGDPGVLGRVLTINGVGYTVIGVAPEGFTGPDTGLRPQLWIPMSMHRQVRPNVFYDWYESRRALVVSAIGRLKPGVDLAAAQGEIGTLAKNLERDYPNDNKGRSVELIPLAEASIAPQIRPVLVKGTGLLLVVTGLVLLIACSNVSNLLLAQAAARRREIAIRLSQGAARGRLVRQLLTESLLLALLGGVFGILLSIWLQALLPKLLPQIPFPVDLELRLDVRVLAFALGIALLTGLLFGLLPAFRSTKAELVSALKNQADAELGPLRGLRLQGALVAGQVALSLVSLIAAGLFLRSLGEAQQVDPGFPTDHLAVIAFDTDLQGWERSRAEQFQRDLRERIAALPGVASATVAQAGPFQGAFLRSVFLEGTDHSNDGILMQVNPVSPGYFDTVGVPLVEGRAITEADRLDAARVVVVNETMANKFWPGQSAVGKRFHFFGDPPVEVVGVARDVKYLNPGENPQPYVYEPLAQRFVSNVSLIVRSVREPESVLPTVQKQVRAMAPGMLLVVSTVPDLVSQSLWARKAGATLLGAFGLLALVLATVGLYGVMSFSVTQRSREIGVRMALGARQADVLGLVLRQGMTLVILGLAVGLLLALSGTRVASGLLFGVSPTDPIAFGTTSAILMLVAFAATLAPALKAVSVPPNVALRYE
jgi:predicted permease